jgi:hypothetical protein
VIFLQLDTALATGTHPLWRIIITCYSPGQT